MINRIMYLRDKSTRIGSNGLPEKGDPIGCVVIASDKTITTVKYNISMKNPEDRFNRKLAREIAEARLISRPFSVEVPPCNNGMTGIHDVSRSVMTDLSQKSWIKDDLPENLTKDMYVYYEIHKNNKENIRNAFFNGKDKVPTSARKAALLWLKNHIPRIPIDRGFEDL